MYKIDIKPLSLNEAYRGRRFTTPSLKSYKQYLNYLLPKLTIPVGKLGINCVFGVSSKNSDGDNLIKCFQDCLSTKYGFNDNMIYQWQIKKTNVKKGKEYIEFDIYPFE